MRTILPLACSLFLFAGVCAAQSAEDGFNCSANNPAELSKHLNSTPGAMEHADEVNARLEARTLGFSGSEQRGGSDPYIIPVVFHIIHNNGPENITDAQVYDAVRILTEDFTKQNPDWQNVRPQFLDIVGDVGIEFRLATRDPDGNCTNGITRTESQQTYDGNFSMTQLSRWPRDRYMNIWVAASAGSGVAGYTYYPMWLDDWPEADGIVVDNSYVGSLGTSSTYRSRVLSHEVGHWLNLAHCWGSTNDPGVASNCSSDDNVSDTPNTIGWTSCFLAGATCGSPLDNVENYMEYSYCDRMFTIGQADRMIAALTSNVAQRSSLWQPDNLALTGVSLEPVLCAANFLYTGSEICAGGMVQFTDVSYHGVVDRSWSFPGGTPSSSTEMDPMVQYDAPGIYPVTLTVSDGVSDLTLTRNNLMVVYADPGIATPFAEGFESITTIPNVDWQVRDADQNGGFETTLEAAFTGLTSVKLTNTSAMSGDLDDLYSPTYDLSDAEEVNISFRYAFARRNNFNDDRLRVYVSNNCGASWSMRAQLRAGIDLNTAGNTSGAFVPNGPDQWGIKVIDNISAAYHSSRFRIRFEFESNGGNNLYIDDLNILGTTVGLAEIGTRGVELRVVPNPASDEAVVVFDNRSSGPLHISVLDLVGRQLFTLYDGQSALGTRRISIPVSKLSAGVYMIRSDQGGIIQTTRFAVDPNGR